MPLLNPDPVFFPQAVESILGQTFRELELIIVEAPSERSGRDLLQRYNDPRIRRQLNPQRTSLPHQRNQTLALADADVVAFLDADDIAEPDRMEKQYRFLEEHPDVDLVGSNLRIIDAGGRTHGYRAILATTMPLPRRCGALTPSASRP